MAWYEDLSHCDYFGRESAIVLRAIGWLECGRPFTTGKVSAKVYKRLVDLCKNPWQPVHLLGTHHCDLCLYEGQTGSRNLFIPSYELIYVCPTLITHYMNEHGYRPPDEFCAAVLACPPMRSMSYLRAILMGGGKSLIGQTPIAADWHS